jgi:ABC-type multidrug transport system fused ATPase/permease subunit
MSRKAAKAGKAGKAGAKSRPVKIGDTRRVVRLLTRFTVGHRKVFVLALLMLVFEAITAVYEPLPLKYLIDYLQSQTVPSWLTVSSTTAVIGVLTVGIVLLAAINSWGDSMAEIYLARGGRMLGYNLRVALFTHLEKLSLAFHNQRRTGDVLTRVTSDVTVLEEFITESVSDLAGSILVLTGTLVFLGVESPEVMLLAVVIIPVMAVVSRGFASGIKTAAKQQRAREGELASHAQEMLTSIGVIQTYGRGPYERQRFAKLSDRAMQSALRGAGLEAWFGWVISVTQAVCISGVIWLGVWLVGRGAATSGDVVLYVLLITNMFKPTKRIIKEWNTIGKVYASVERVEELLDREPSVREEPGAVEAPPLTGHIEFREVSFAYLLEPGPDGQGPRLALDELSFTIEPGRTVALVGHSGAGKSTIAQLLPRLYDPHTGQVLFDGYDAREFTLASLRSQISMVLQETVLFTGTIADNIAYGRPEASREEIVEAARKANAHEFIEQMPDGYDSELNERGGNLSGGQRQRLAIARSFIRETPILILDEPTTGLDAESTQLVVDALEKLIQGKTTIIISHDLNLIRSADEVMVMSAGQVVQHGTHDELIGQDGLYATLHARQFGAAAGARAPAEPAPAEPEAVAVPDIDLTDDDAPVPVQRRAFETALMEALPLPASPEAFRLLMGKAKGRPGPPPARPAPAPRVPEPAMADGHHGGDSPGGDAPVPVPLVPVPPAEAEASPNGAGAEEAETRAARADFSDDGELPAQARVAPASPFTLGPDALDPAASAAVRRELPGLADALDAEAMRPHLTALLGEGWTLRDCIPGQRLYQPGRGAIVRYALRLDRAGSGEPVERLVTGRLLPRGVDAGAWLAERAEAMAAEWAGREELAPFAVPVAAVAERHMVLHAFPLDPELPGLLAASDPERAIELVRPVVDGAGSCQVELVTYGRRDRCVLRYRIDKDTPGDRTLYAKVYREGPDEAARLAAAAVRAAVAAGGPFTVAGLAAYDAELRVALIEPVPGTARVPALVKSGSDPDQLEADLVICTRLAAAVHGADADAPERTVDAELAALRQELIGVGGRSPALGIRLTRWLAPVEAAAAATEPLPLGPAHGHLGLSHLLLDGDRCGLIDLDSICLAEPALDLGSFLAHLRLAVTRAGGPAGDNGSEGRADRLAGVVLGAYADAAGVDLELLRRRVAVFEAISLARTALRSWEKLKVARLMDVLRLMHERPNPVRVTAR